MHGIEQVTRLVADGFERGACQFGRPGLAGEAGNGGAGLRIPEGRAQPDKGGYEIDLLGRVGPFGERAGFGGRLDDTQHVAQPLHRGTGHEDRAFERVGGLAVEAIGDGRKQAVLRAHEIVPRIEQRKAAGAIGGFQHAGPEAGLADGGCLLVAGDAVDGDGGAEMLGRGGAEIGSVVEHFGQDGCRHAEELQQVRVPFICADIVEHGARGVGGVGDVARAVGQLPDEEGVDGAEGELALFGALPGARHIVENPSELGGREIGVEHEAGLLGDTRLFPLLLQLVAELGGAAILPDDGAIDGLAGFPIPDDGGFALVGNADGGDLRRLGPGGADGGMGACEHRLPDFGRVVLHPPILGEVLGEFELADAGDVLVAIEQQSPARSGALVDRQHEIAHSPLPSAGCSGMRHPFV